jgi:hypothetical protein
MTDADLERRLVELELECLRAFIHSGPRWLSPADFKRYKRLEEREREYQIHDAINNRRNETCKSDSPPLPPNSSPALPQSANRKDNEP